MKKLLFLLLCLCVCAWPLSASNFSTASSGGTADDLSDNSISDLQDVDTSGDAPGDILIRNAADTMYENQPVSGDATITSLGVVAVANDSHNHTSSTISGLDISDDTNLAVSAPITLTDDTVGITQNAGTDVTADLEEETHATEHSIGAADEIEFYGEVQDEDVPLTRRRLVNFEGTGVSCADDTTKTTCTIPGAGSATITVEEGDVTLSGAVNDLDFQSGFDTTETPAGEANISLDLSEVVTGDITCATNSCTVNANSVALSTDTTGDYVMTVADGTGIDGTATGEGSTYTPTLDTTEINDTTWGDNSDATIIHTFDPTGATNPAWSYSNGVANLSTGSLQEAGNGVIVAGDTFSGDITATLESDGDTPLTIASNSVALTTDTTGNYVGNVATTSPLTGGSAGSEGASLILSITANGITATEIDETSNYTFTGSLINSGTNPTVDATGEIGQDTTDNQLLYGSAPNVISPKRSAAFRLEDVTSTDDNFLFWLAPMNVTVTDVACKYSGTGSTVATFSLEDDDGNAMTHTAPTCTAEGTESSFQSVTAANTLLTGEGLRFDTTNTPSPTTDDYIIEIKYTIDRT